MPPQTFNPATNDVYDTAALRKLDAAHYLHPFTDHAALKAKEADNG